MHKNKTVTFLSLAFIWLSACSVVLVAAMAIVSPQSVMDLVSVKLANNDALSSIRGVYGGVGLTVFLSLVYLQRKDPDLALRFLGIFWGSYALSRLITLLVNGPLGAFGIRWLVIELVFTLLAVTLLAARKPRTKSIHPQAAHRASYSTGR